MTRVVKVSGDRIEFALRIWDGERRAHVDLHGWVTRDMRLHSPSASIPFTDRDGRHAGWLCASIGSNGPGNPRRHSLHRDIRKLLKP